MAPGAIPGRQQSNRAAPACGRGQFWRHRPCGCCLPGQLVVGSSRPAPVAPECAACSPHGRVSLSPSPGVPGPSLLTAAPLLDSALSAQPPTPTPHKCPLCHHLPTNQACNGSSSGLFPANSCSPLKSQHQHLLCRKTHTCPVSRPLLGGTVLGTWWLLSSNQPLMESTSVFLRSSKHSYWEEALTFRVKLLVIDPY